MLKKRWGDRYDGRRIWKGDPFNVIIPFIMEERDDSQVFFDAEVNVDEIDKCIKEKRKNGENIGFLDYFIAIIVRTISQYPRMNRFIAGKRLYARDDITISMAVKKELSVDTEETAIKFKFAPNATVTDVANTIRAKIEENKGKAASNDADKLVGVLNRLPRALFSAVVGLLKAMDYDGVLPKFIHELSPFHTSVFVTNMGSIGAEPIYHHIYNFGTTSVFIALGNRHKQKLIDKDGNIMERKVMKIRFVADERIADGYYLSIALKYFSNLFSKPDLLEVPPECVVEDDQI
jgi:pyruvate/2-oxoglutarate dehydrogenase complex dihydrolipoamide acyltransferase (E2) component